MVLLTIDVPFKRGGIYNRKGDLELPGPDVKRVRILNISKTISFMNSSYESAHNLNLLVPKNDGWYTLDPILDSHLIIAPDEELEVTLTICRHIEASFNEVYGVYTGFEKYLNDVGMLLEYTDVNGNYFSTRYYYEKEKDNRNDYRSGKSDLIFV